MGRVCFAGALAAIGIVSVSMPLMDAAIAQRWFSWPNIAFLAPIPVITPVIAVAEWRSLDLDGLAGPYGQASARPASSGQASCVPQVFAAPVDICCYFRTVGLAGMIVGVLPLARPGPRAPRRPPS